MHKVLNYGSALQAYALQETIKRLGHDCELIDYIPLGTPSKSTLIHRLIKTYHKHYEKIKQRKFNIFYDRFFFLSAKRYNGYVELHSEPPVYAIYVTGSDQVWNIKHIGYDTTFLLSFVSENARRISYASSLAMSSIPDTHREVYKKYLNKYHALSTREERGAKIIESLVEIDVKVTLDPTLLLNASDWKLLAKKSNLKIDYPYILVYVLDYAYNPYPYITNFIKFARKETNLPLVLLNFSNKEYIGWKNVINLHDAVGPEDFIYLFDNASLVITTSFHGVAYSLNLSKPFYAVLNNVSDGDDRMFSLLKELGAEDRILKKGDKFSVITLEMNYVDIQHKLEERREQSKNFLRRNLV